MKDSKELTKAEPSAVALPADAGMSQAWDEDTAAIARGTNIPQLKIAHPNCEDLPNGAPYGSIYNNLSGEWNQSWRIAILAVQVRNSLMPAYVRGQKAQAICKSSNGMTPTGGTEQLAGPCRERLPNGQRREVCEMLQWKKGTDGKWIKPLCMSQYACLVIDLESMMPALYSFRRQGTKVFEKLQAQMMYARTRCADKDNPKIPVECLVPIEFSATPKDNYYIPVVRLLTASEDRIPIETAKTLAQMQSELKAMLTRIDNDEVMQAAGSEEQFTNGNGSPAEFEEEKDDDVPF